MFPWFLRFYGFGKIYGFENLFNVSLVNLGRWPGSNLHLLSEIQFNPELPTICLTAGIRMHETLPGLIRSVRWSGAHHPKLPLRFPGILSTGNDI